MEKDVDDLENNVEAVEIKPHFMDPVQNIKVEDNPENDKTNFPLASRRKQNSELENSNNDDDNEAWK